MSGFRFVNQFGTGAFYIGFTGAANTLAGSLLPSVAFLPAGSSGSPAPDSYTLAEAWTTPDGLLLLLGAPLSAPASFLESLHSLALPAQTRIVWIINPGAPAAQWVYAALRFGPVTGGSAALHGRGRLPLDLTGAQGYGFDLPAGTVTELAGESSLRFGAAAFGRGAHMLPAGPAGLTIDLAGNGGAQMRFDTALPGGAALTEWFDQLDIGLRYSRTLPDGTAESVRFPLFASSRLHPGMQVSGTVTLGRLADRALSVLLARADGPDTLFSTTLRTVTGRRCLLDTTGFSFAFARRSPDADGGHTLVPEAACLLSVGPQGKAVAAVLADDDLVCGATGTEYIRLPHGGTGTRLDLVAGMPAHAGAGAALTDGTTTAWVRISGAQPLDYFAQPAGQAAMFDATNPVGTSEVPLLPYFPVRAAQIGPHDDAPVFPLVPLAGLADPDVAAGLAIEAGAIAPARNAALSGLRRAQGRDGTAPGLVAAGSRFADDGALTAITPQGLEAGFVAQDGGQWSYVQIARLNPPNTGQLRLTGAPAIEEPLLSALLTSEQFIVISDPAALARYFADPATTNVSLGGWQFLLQTESWADHGTILIIKNASSALGQLARDPGSWTDAAVFNASPAATCATLHRIIAEAEAKADGGASDFAFFVDVVVRSADWNGFLFLNTGLGALPDSLIGLRAGIDPARFFGHHLGVTQTQFRSLDDLRARETAMFGLIRYADQGRAFPGGPAWMFRVEELDVLFRDTQVVSFRSSLAAYLPAIFGQVPVPVGGGQPVMRMEGTHQRRGDQDTYLFTTTREQAFDLPRGALRQVTMLQAAFETLSVDPGPDGLVRAQFTFAGRMAFADVTKADGQRFDLFSFTDLAFANLAVTLTFPRNAPARTTWAFSVEAMQLQESLSVARGGSLFEGLPLKLGRILTGATGGPGAQGYMTVVLPQAVTPLTGPWFGLSMALDMGSLTEVAGAAGLTAALMVSWGLQDGQIAVGLNLPGASSASTELSLMGVIKLRIYALSLRHGDDGWALMLNGMTLGLFGKTLPADGSFDFYLFGNPDRQTGASSLGWYGAYAAKEQKKPASALPRADAISAPQTQPPPAPTLRRRARRISRGETP